jgi:enoyl-CoA hydratase/carnithine racemase
MSDDTVLYETDGAVAVVTLNRPQVLNAVTMPMEERLGEVLRRADEDESVRCIVVTGAGRGFCAGDDIKVQWSDQLMADALERLASPRGGLTPMVEVLLSSSTPSVAAVNGPAVGFGMDLALMCDIRVASTEARFAQAYIRMGLVPDVPGFWLLPQLVGRSVAAQLLLTGETVDAAAAAAMGLVSAVVRPDELLPTALATARRIAANPPLAVAATKEGLRRGIGRRGDELGDLAAIRGARLHRLFQSEDHQEAVAAFLERRPGQYRGR